MIYTYMYVYVCIECNVEIRGKYMGHFVYFPIVFKKIHAFLSEFFNFKINNYTKILQKEAELLLNIIII